MQKQIGDRHGQRRHFTYTDMDGDWENQDSRRGRSRTNRIRHKPLEKYSRSQRYEWFEEERDDDNDRY